MRPPKRSRNPTGILDDLLGGQACPHLAEGVLRHLDYADASNVRQAAPGAFAGCGQKAWAELAARHNLGRHLAEDLIRVKDGEILEDIDHVIKMSGFSTRWCSQVLNI